MRGADTTALAGRFVVAHAVGPEREGPLDSVATGAAGGFRFRVARPESATVYLVSAQYAGIGYFSEPFTREARGGAGSILLAVFDTTTSGAPLSVALRHIIVQQPGPDGTRRALDLVYIANHGLATRVGRDTSEPVWATLLPSGVVEPAVSQGELPPSAARFAGGRVEVAAAFPPGQKQLVLSYTIPKGARRLRVLIDQTTERLEVLIEGAGARAGGEFVPGSPMVLDGREFRRFSAARLQSGAAPTIRFGREGGAGGPPWWIAVAAAAALMAAAAVRLLRSPAAARSPAPEPSRESLLAAIVALDERYEGREREVDPAEWAEYRRRRTELKETLAARVARR